MIKLSLFAVILGYIIAVIFTIFILCLIDSLIKYLNAMWIYAI